MEIKGWIRKVLKILLICRHLFRYDCLIDINLDAIELEIWRVKDKKKDEKQEKVVE
jgi:hypothetical protein